MKKYALVFLFGILGLAQQVCALNPLSPDFILAKKSTQPTAMSQQVQPTAEVPWQQPTAMSQQVQPTAEVPWQQPTATMPSTNVQTEVPALDCTVRTFIKNSEGFKEQDDPYIVLGKWTNGNATFQTAKVCGAVKAKGGNSFDVIWDQDADNVSFILNPVFTWADIQAIAAELGISRIGIVHNHPSGRSCIEYDVSTPTAIYGETLYYHLYDRADWTANPAYFCAALPLATPAP